MFTRILSGQRLNTFPDATPETTPETTPPRDPIAAVVNNPMLTRKISRHVMKTLPRASALPTSAWQLEKARMTASLGGINRTFAATTFNYTDDALQALEQGKVTLTAMFSAFHTRLARAYLPSRYPAHEGRREALAAQMTAGLLAQSSAAEHDDAECHEMQAIVECFLNAAYQTAPSPRTPISMQSSETIARCNALVGDIVQFTHAFFCYLAEGTPDLARLDAIVQQSSESGLAAKPFWYDKLMLNAAQSGDWKTVKLLLEHGRSQAGQLACTYLSDFVLIECPLHPLVTRVQTDHEHATGLLHLAATQGDTAALEYVHGKLQASHVSIDYPDPCEQTALYHAVKGGQDAACAWLIAHQAEADTCDATGTTLLHIVRQPAIAAALIQAGAGVDGEDDTYNQPLHVQSDPEIVQMLVRAGADVNALNEHHQTPLHFAKEPAAIATLIGAGADVTVQDDWDNCPLHEQMHPDVVRQLLDAGADANTVGEIGKTPLHKAIHAEAATMLLRAGARIDALDQNLESPLFCALNENIIALLCAEGADIGLVNRSDRTVLEDWLMPSEVTCLPADLDAITALHHACESTGRTAQFRQLLDRRSLHGQAPLHRFLCVYDDRLDISLCELPHLDHRALDDQIAIARHFKAWGADLEARDHRGESAHDHVIRQQKHMSRWLIRFATMPAPLQARCLTNYLPWKARLDTLEELLRPLEATVHPDTSTSKRKWEDIGSQP